MIQSELPFDATKLHRADGPSTSRAAAESSKHLRARHHATILDIMAEGGDWNADEIADRCGLDRHQIGRRLGELERHSKVAKSGVKRPSHTGRMAACYQVEGAR